MLLLMLGTAKRRAMKLHKLSHFGDIAFRYLSFSE